jgi:signal transduction histidine kinase
VIATTTYADESLRQLRAPAQDATEFAAVLADPAIGGFTVAKLIDRTAQEIRMGVVDFLSGRGVDELLVLYLSCHGIRDKRGRLYFAATDSRKSHLSATGIESNWLLDQLYECRARRQVVILDCCFSGAFGDPTKGEADMSLDRRFGQGRGRAVLTASRAEEYSFEGEPLPGATIAGSVFTTGMVQGLRTGEADTDRDGYISVEDAHDYAYDYVRAQGVAQTPQRWSYEAEGKIWLARSPAGAIVTPVPLPEAVRFGLDSPHPEIRLGAVKILDEWLGSDVPAQRLAAREELRKIAETEVPRIAAVARELLTTHEAQTTTDSLVDDQRIVWDARREATRLVEEAQKEHDRILAQARHEADGLLAARSATLRELDERLATTEQDLAISRAAVEAKQAEATELTDAATAREREVRQIAQRRAAAEREETILRAQLDTLRGQLDQERAGLDKDQRAARALAERTVNNARHEAHTILADAAAQTRRIQATGVTMLPAANFAIVKRGYDQDQVDSYVADLRSAVLSSPVGEVAARPEFAVLRQGYSPNQVDAHINLMLRLREQARAAQTVHSSAATMSVNMLRRSQNLVDRLIAHLDRLERAEKDQDRLNELFQLDHLATRLRRNDENLLVLLGADSTRVQREPAPLMSVLRAAQSEIELYQRIELTAVDRGIEIAPHAVNDLVHLAAELFDNATMFSPPDTMVTVSGRRAGDRAVLRIEDRGIGMSADQQAEINNRLATPPAPDTFTARMVGLVVVARLADRLSVKVKLQPSARGGTIADVHLPATVLVWRPTAQVPVPDEHVARPYAGPL